MNLRDGSRTPAEACMLSQIRLDMRNAGQMRLDMRNAGVCTLCPLMSCRAGVHPFSRHAHASDCVCVNNPRLRVNHLSVHMSLPLTHVGTAYKPSRVPMPSRPGHCVLLLVASLRMPIVSDNMSAPNSSWNWSQTLLLSHALERETAIGGEFPPYPPSHIGGPPMLTQILWWQKMQFY